MTILQWSLPHSDMNQPWVFMWPLSWTILPPPSPSHPSGSSLCSSPECPSHASNLNWRSISHMIIYMFQCCSLKSSHPHLLPQSPKVCSLYLGLFCCLVYRVIVTIFLNSFVSLGKFILKYFILFIAMVSGIISLISLSDFSLLVYRNARDFCVLILYGSQILNHWTTREVVAWLSLGVQLSELWHTERI